MGFDLESVESRWIMTGSDHNAAHKLAPEYFERNVGSRIGTIQHYDAKSIGCNDFRGSPGKCPRLEADIKPYEDSLFASCDGFEIRGCGLRCLPDILECERVGDNGPPTVGTKLDRTLHNEE
jgi:hypothetical protein